jgi:hypothetical protein
MTGEERLWRAVLMRAGMDAHLNNYQEHLCDAVSLYSWSTSRDCAEICQYASMDVKSVRRYFHNILKKKTSNSKK